jgi:urease accessory protein
MAADSCDGRDGREHSGERSGDPREHSGERSGDSSSGGRDGDSRGKVTDGDSTGEPSSLTETVTGVAGVDPLASLRDPPPGFDRFAAEELPQAPAGSRGKAGAFEARFERGADGRTRLVADRVTVPFHLAGTVRREAARPGVATVCVQTPTGGIAQGDRQATAVAVGADAHARVTTGAATKVLRMERNYGAESVSIRVGSDGSLEYVPEPTILYRDARFARSVDATIEPGGVLLFGDVLVPGRLARGEAFGFDRYRADLVVRGADGDLFVDAVDLDGDGDASAADASDVSAGTDGADAAVGVASPRGPAGFGDARVLGTFYAVSPDPAVDADALADRLHEAASTAIGDAGADTDSGDGPRTAVASASTLPRGSGAIVRALGWETTDVRGPLDAAYDAARRALLDAPAPAGRRW